MAQTRQMNAIAEVRLQLDAMLGQFAAVLPKHITAERFARVVLTAIQNTPELLDCDRRSIWNAAMRAANDGLPPDGRLGAIVVYKDRKRGIKLAQWLPMIAGIRQKVRNSGEVATWEAHVVHERDQWEYEEGDNPHILHRPVGGDRGKIIAAYSIARLKTGELSREWMWIEELDKVRAVSKAERGPWQDWPEEMYRKTVAKRHAKVLPMNSDLDDLLRRPDEPEDDPPTPDGYGEAGGERARHMTSMADALDMIAANTEAAARKKAAPDEIRDEPDGEMKAWASNPMPHAVGDPELDDGEVIDQGEYADSDDELPLGGKDHDVHDRA